MASNSKEKLTLLLEVNAAGYFKLKLILIYHSENPRALKNSAKSTLTVPYKWKNKAWTIAQLFTTWFTKYFKPSVKTHCSEKGLLLKYYYSLLMHMVTQEF